jgi:hypothetical protein
MLESALFWFLIFGVAAFLIAGTLAPLETMSWWAGHHAQPLHVSPEHPAMREAAHYIVYLGGIDSVDGEIHTPYERPLLEALEDKLGDSAIIRSVFPYAASGEALLRGPRIFRCLWRRLQALRKKHSSWLTSLINARNFFQLLVAADRRYGPIFNEALASLILDALVDAGWRQTDQAHRLSLIGYSGGVQMAIGAAPFLARRWRGPIGVVSIGGTVIEPAGMDYVDRLDHLVGSGDLAVRLSALMCASRWPIALRSAWARARRDARIHVVPLGRIGHTGSHGYLGMARPAGSARTGFETTLTAMLASLSRPLSLRAPRGRFRRGPNSGCTRLFSSR